MAGRVLEAGLHLLDRQLVDATAGSPARSTTSSSIPLRRRPASVSFAVVKRIESAMELSLPKAELATNRLESWTSDHLIGKLPGAGDAPD